MAADTRSVKLVSVLVELNPHFLQEDWLLQNQLPEKLIAHPDFCDWLVGYRKQPPCFAKAVKVCNPLPVGDILHTKGWGASSAQTSEDISHSCGISILLLLI